jgi:HSP20 family protein
MFSLFPFRESPFSKLSQRYIDNIEREIFADFERPASLFKTTTYFSPMSKIDETESTYSIHIVLPGHNSKSVDVDIKVESKSFIVTASSAKATIPEISSDYDLEYALPSGVDTDNIEAKITDGILTLTLKKITKSAKNYKVAVK